jgi:hypothetical protein
MLLKKFVFPMMLKTPGSSSLSHSLTNTGIAAQAVRLSRAFPFIQTLKRRFLTNHRRAVEMQIDSLLP